MHTEEKCKGFSKNAFHSSTEFSSQQHCSCSTHWPQYMHYYIHQHCSSLLCQCLSMDILRTNCHTDDQLNSSFFSSLYLSWHHMHLTQLDQSFQILMKTKSIQTMQRKFLGYQLMKTFLLIYFLMDLTFSYSWSWPSLFSLLTRHQLQQTLMNRTSSSQLKVDTMTSI